MSKLPKLKLTMPNGHEEIRDIKEDDSIYSNWTMLVLAGGQVVNSYEELVQLASQDQYKDKEFLEVTIIPFIEGG